MSQLEERVKRLMGAKPFAGRMRKVRTLFCSPDSVGELEALGFEFIGYLEVEGGVVAQMRGPDA